MLLYSVYTILFSKKSCTPLSEFKPQTLNRHCESRIISFIYNTKAKMSLPAPFPESTYPVFARQKQQCANFCPDCTSVVKKKKIERPSPFSQPLFLLSHSIWDQEAQWAEWREPAGSAAWRSMPTLPTQVCRLEAQSILSGSRRRHSNASAYLFCPHMTHSL